MILSIDPGCIHTGIVVVDEGLIAWQKTMSGQQALAEIPNVITIYNIKCAVVKMPQRDEIFKRYEAQKQSVATYRIGHILLAENIGRNIELTLAILDTLQSNGVKVREIVTSRAYTKWDLEHWKRVFKWEGIAHPSRQARAAAVLALQYEGVRETSK